MSRFASVHRRPVVNQKMTTPAWAPCDLLSTPNAIQFSCRMMFSFCLKVVAISTKGSKRLLAFGFEREEVFHADIHDSKSSPAPIMETQWKMTSLVSQIATYSSIFYDLMGCFCGGENFFELPRQPLQSWHPYSPIWHKSMHKPRGSIPRWPRLIKLLIITGSCFFSF